VNPIQRINCTNHFLYFHIIFQLLSHQYLLSIRLSNYVIQEDDTNEQILEKERTDIDYENTIYQHKHSIVIDWTYLFRIRVNESVSDIIPTFQSRKYENSENRINYIVHIPRIPFPTIAFTVYVLLTLLFTNSIMR